MREKHAKYARFGMSAHITNTTLIDKSECVTFAFNGPYAWNILTDFYYTIHFWSCMMAQLCE